MASVGVNPRNWRLGDKNESREAKIGDFVIPPNSLIGEGGNGYAYLATHPTLGDVVVKIDKANLTKKTIRYMEQEVHAHDILSRHPNCSQMVTCLLGAMKVKLLDRKDSTGLYHEHGLFVLERMQGDAYTLATNAPRSGGTTVQLLEMCFLVHLKMVEQVRFIHSRGLVHGDVKPENVLFSQHPNGDIDLKMSDLGSACNPTRDCGDQYGCTYFYRTKAYARSDANDVMDPPSQMRMDNDLFGCAVSLPVLMMAARLLPYVSDKWSDEDRRKLASDMEKYKTGMPIVDAGLRAVHTAIVSERYTDDTFAAAYAALNRLKAAAPVVLSIAPPRSPHAPTPSATTTKMLSAAASISSPVPVYTAGTTKTASMHAATPPPSHAATPHLSIAPTISMEIATPSPVRPPKRRCNRDLGAGKTPSPPVPVYSKFTPRMSSPMVLPPPPKRRAGRELEAVALRKPTNRFAAPLGMNKK